VQSRKPWRLLRYRSDLENLRFDGTCGFEEYQRRPEWLLGKAAGVIFGQAWEICGVSGALKDLQLHLMALYK